MMGIVLVAILTFINLMMLILKKSELQEKWEYLSNFERYITSIHDENKRDQIVDLYINHLLSEMTTSDP